ncbi:MAG: hypothetical protein H7318_00560 [Oligoflexus sp.]|nr:hypothetical protein [Oligoflexus sp.]
MRHLFLLFILLFPLSAYAEEPEVMTITGTREPVQGSSSLHPVGSDRAPLCMTPNCGKPRPEPDEAGLFRIIKAMKPPRFLCTAVQQCQSQSSIGESCVITGVYLTADETLIKMKAMNCCNFTKGKGLPIALEWQAVLFLS